MADRTIARVVGALFILASAAAILGGLLLLPVDDRAAVAEIAAAEAVAHVGLGHVRGKVVITMQRPTGR